jgi:NADPH:quinone reductase-like Zn-dependent oxidoreductase
MRAVVLDAPGPPEALQIRELPVPEPAPGRVLIEVRAGGLNRVAGKLVVSTTTPS